MKNNDVDFEKLLHEAIGNIGLSSGEDAKKKFELYKMNIERKRNFYLFLIAISTFLIAISNFIITIMKYLYPQ